MGATWSSAVTPSGALLAKLVQEADLSEVSLVVQSNPQLLFKSLGRRLGNPLHVAAAAGRTAVVQLLLHQAQLGSAHQQSAGTHGADSCQHVLRLVNSRNDRNQTPLMLAIEQGHTQVVHVLLDMGADRWATDTLGGRCALHYAAKANQPLLVAALVEGAGPAPADMPFPNTTCTRYVDARTLCGFTPLHLAVRNGSLEAAAALLQAGAQLQARNVYDGEWLDLAKGTTPLHIAARLGNHDMVLLLLQAWAQLPVAVRGPDPRLLKDSEYHLAYHAAHARRHRNLLDLLDPAAPLSPVDQGSMVLVAVGPPRLARLAADALRRKLRAALEAAGDAAAAATQAPSCSSCCSTLVSESAEQQDDLDCPVCLGTEEGHQVQVVLAPCKHSLCSSCCHSLLQAQDVDYLRCPLCRAAVADVCRASPRGA